MEPRDKLILQIMALGYAVQKHTDYCVFMDFSGHVDTMMIDIRESKERWENKVCEASIYTKMKEYMDKKQDMASLKARRDVLKEILVSLDIPYKKMEREIINTYKHTF